MLSEDRAERQRVIKRLRRTLVLREAAHRNWYAHRFDPDQTRYVNTLMKISARVVRIRMTLQGYEQEKPE